jgi:predicted NodU family carbamoyl transferase
MTASLDSRRSITTAACLLVDGEIVAAAQEERFTRKKHDPAFPANAVQYCLRTAGMTAKDIDYVVFYEKPMRKFERLLETYLAYAPSGFASFAMALPVWLKEKTRSGKDSVKPRRRRLSSPITTRVTPRARSSRARTTRRRF